MGSVRASGHGLRLSYRLITIPGSVDISWSSKIRSFKIISGIVLSGCMLSVALNDSTAAALDPSLDIVDGLFPITDAIDLWARDPPLVSALGFSS